MSPARGSPGQPGAEVPDLRLLRQTSVPALSAEEAFDVFRGRHTGPGLFVPGASHSGKVEPDLVLASKGGFADQEEYHDPSPVPLVAEVTSPSTGAECRTSCPPSCPFPNPSAETWTPDSSESEADVVLDPCVFGKGVVRCATKGGTASALA
ncbi:hypothetical protein ACWD5Q_21440 [Streptomyces sp. NPDC002513]